MTQTLSVAAIKYGTVIDHIPAGQALKIMRLLKLAEAKLLMTLGLNLPSQHLGLKDIIKIENKLFTLDEADQIALFAPEATVNSIENFVVTHKNKNNHLPNFITNILKCPNKNCISQTETVSSYFYVDKFSINILLQCRYCEKKYARDFILMAM